jgi:hypothetical protein
MTETGGKRDKQHLGSIRAKYDMLITNQKLKNYYMQNFVNITKWKKQVRVGIFSFVNQFFDIVK